MGPRGCADSNHPLQTVSADSEGTATALLLHTTAGGATAKLLPAWRGALHQSHQRSEYRLQSGIVIIIIINIYCVLPYFALCYRSYATNSFG